MVCKLDVASAFEDKVQHAIDVITKPSTATGFPVGRLHVASQAPLAMSSQLQSPVAPPSPPGQHCNVSTIVVPGRSCGHKSALVPALASHLQQQGKDVYIIPEATTFVRNGGCQMTKRFGNVAWEEFIKQVLAVQVQMEDSFLQCARSTGNPSVLIFESAIIDLSVCVELGVWENLVAELSLSHEDVLKRYDLVLRFAVRGEQDCNGQHTDLRATPLSPSHAPVLEDDSRIAKAWRKHPNVCIFDVNCSIPDMVQQATDAIASGNAANRIVDARR